jgi:ATPase subunit of ABC transporter with duplicated ATPase domains
MLARVKLSRFTYSEHEQSGEEWQIEPLTFGEFNLIVGRNAAGKTRLLKAIARAVGELSGEPHGTSRSAKFEVTVEDGNDQARVDWAKRTQYFPFATGMDLRREGFAQRLDFATVLKLGLQLHGKSFEDRILHQLAHVGYPMQELDFADAGVKIKEPSRKATTPFRRLSQAQQRTLTLLTFLNFLAAESHATTVLIDDFAEGLDFEHAAALTNLILKGYAASSLQFILTSNDRYVMNAVPLEHWTVLVEEGTITRVFNYQNSKQKFDDFKFTGLSNFDFFSMDFAREPA